MKELIKEYGMLLLACIAGLSVIAINFQTIYGPFKNEIIMVVKSL